MTLAPFDQQKVKKRSKLETQRSDFNDNRFIVCKLGSKVHVTSFRAISVPIFWLPNCLIRSCSQVGFIRFSTFLYRASFVFRSLVVFVSGTITNLVMAMFGCRVRVTTTWNCTASTWTVWNNSFRWNWPIKQPLRRWTRNKLKGACPLKEVGPSLPAPESGNDVVPLAPARNQKPLLRIPNRRSSSIFFFLNSIFSPFFLDFSALEWMAACVSVASAFFKKS